ncbi:MAG TPA: HAMP domain-containing sensor histidine kinase [Acidimicrobiia bacterium]|jgi:two-component system OmpR family sensor kinase|nr:HAMP domain-containing sensor histidine kinase [Acidimicrobiia bacterium]
MSLRARLVLVVLSIVTVGLVASNLATATLLHSYLIGRIDDRLDATGDFAAFLLRSADRSTPPAADPRRGGPPAPRAGNPEVQAARIDSKGHVVKALRGPFSVTSNAFEVLPPGPLAAARAGRTTRFEFTSPSGRYRGVAMALAGTTDVAVVISPLRDVEATMVRLYWIEGIATAVMLMLAGALALWLVRLGLRPIVHIADTADAVAAGEVDRRVDISGGYEVARLGRALNSAFDARSASEQTLREFISDASHELRTPLTSIRGYAELLRAGALPGEAESSRAVARIEHEAARMGVLVDDLLSLARLDEGRPLQLVDVDLAAIAADAVHDASAVEPDRPITLVAPRPVHVVGDETTLRQVFANLLSNARQHTATGTTVEVRVGATPEGARIDVIDDGAGIEANERERVFDRFWRSDDERRAPGGGSGLGLAIVAAVAAAHGGTAYVDSLSEPSRGAHLVVALPARPPA